MKKFALETWGRFTSENFKLQHTTSVAKTWLARVVSEMSTKDVSEMVQ